MNFQSIKTKFILHLKQMAQLEGGAANLDASDESIFSHQSEFKQFLKDEYNIQDNSLLTIDVSDILKMNIVDGKLVDPNKPEQTDNEEDANLEEEPDTVNQEETDGNWLSGFVSDLFEDKTFKDNIDSDQSGDIDEKELGDFLNYIKGLDEDSSTLSLKQWKL